MKSFLTFIRNDSDPESAPGTNPSLLLVPDDTLSSRKPDGFLPTFCLSSERHKRINEDSNEYTDPQAAMSMSMCQVAQMLQYQSNETLAECTIALALEGIPSTYILRKNLAVQSSATYADIDASLIDYHRNQSKPSSVGALCEGPARWMSDTRKEDTSTPRDLSVVLHSMAAVATTSLAWMTAACMRTVAHIPTTLTLNIRPTSNNARIHPFPDYGVLIGIVYDSTSIHLVAHIQYSIAGAPEPRYLSLLFATLPFPDSGDSTEFIRHRYRAALAMLCIQQHVFRMTFIGEDVDWHLFKDCHSDFPEIIFQGESTPNPSDTGYDQSFLIAVDESMYI
ncbi:hypothetical protein B0H21DRAFT_421703 [Amylocystis lapponica]|nr:hypothetical protein B0H21DRAFT_421703 [Amylocystis lapponica]